MSNSYADHNHASREAGENRTGQVTAGDFGGRGPEAYSQFPKSERAMRRKLDMAAHYAVRDVSLSFRSLPALLHHVLPTGEPVFYKGLRYLLQGREDWVDDAIFTLRIHWDDMADSGIYEEKGEALAKWFEQQAATIRAAMQAGGTAK